MQIEIYGNQVVGTNPGHVIFKSPVSGISAASMCYCVLAFEVLSNISILPLYQFLRFSNFLRFLFS